MLNVEPMSSLSPDAPPDAPLIPVQVNGQRHTCLPAMPLLLFLEQLGMNPRLVAIEYNGEILHRQFWPETQIQPNDRLEIVTIVGGG